LGLRKSEIGADRGVVTMVKKIGRLRAERDLQLAKIGSAEGVQANRVQEKARLGLMRQRLKFQKLKSRTKTHLKKKIQHNLKQTTSEINKIRNQTEGLKKLTTKISRLKNSALLKSAYQKYIILLGKTHALTQAKKSMNGKYQKLIRLGKAGLLAKIFQRDLEKKKFFGKQILIVKRQIKKIAAKDPATFKKFASRKVKEFHGEHSTLKNLENYGKRLFHKWYAFKSRLDRPETKRLSPALQKILRKKVNSLHEKIKRMRLLIKNQVFESGTIDLDKIKNFDHSTGDSLSKVNLSDINQVKKLVGSKIQILNKKIQSLESQKAKYTKTGDLSYAHTTLSKIKELKGKIGVLTGKLEAMGKS
jgi:hypothetical protein